MTADSPTADTDRAESAGDQAAPEIRREYTAAQLAQLLGVGAWRVRNWHRRGWIVARRQRQRLLYFDFAELTIARRLAELLRTGATTRQIRAALGEFQRCLGKPERPLADLPLHVDGSQLVFREGETLLEPSGQRRFDFAAADQADREAGPTAASAPPEIFLAGRRGESALAPHRLVETASIYEEQGELKTAAELLRAALAAGGPRAEICFQLADLLYRLGETAAARERLYMTLELDEEYVEARANLGCILGELGEHELALAALQGAVEYHPEYADAHYHLARALDEAGRSAEAVQHWRRFLALAPASPWADEAARRLQPFAPR